MDLPEGQLTHVLELGDDGRHDEKILYRLSKGNILRLTIAPPLQHVPVHLFTNFPLKGKEFVRSEFQELKFELTHGALVSTGIGQRWTDLHLFLSGAFEFYFTYKDEGMERRVSGCFIVEPQLSVNGKPLRLDAVAMQTVLAKSLGPIAEWEDRLRVSAESGFNIVHFTPVQHLGQSNSSYSLANQLELNPSLFDTTNGQEEAEKQLAALLAKMEKEYGLLSLSDVVWNHTADNSPWLADHPEAGYNLENCPHLTQAYELDEALMRFSHNIVMGYAVHADSGKKIPTEIESREGIQLIRQSLEEDVLPQLRLWEYYVIPVDQTVEAFKDQVKDSDPFPVPEDLVNVPQDQAFQYRLQALQATVSITQGQRHGTIDLELAASLCYIESEGDSKEDVLQWAVGELQHIIDVINMPLYDTFNSDLTSAVDSVCNTAAYQRLDENGPKVGPISYSFPLAFTYFTRLGPSRACATYNSSHGGKTEEELPYTGILDDIDRQYICANNGWIWGETDPLKDFAAVGSKVYERRDVIIWGDCVKLRYGSSPEDSPFLWDFMKEYSLWTAKHFHGIRIDNCHSTPRHVAQYMLDAARKIRPELYVMAELFTGSEGTDNEFLNMLGINSLIREGMQPSTCQDLGRLVHLYGGAPIGSFGALSKEVQVKPAQAHALFMDCTHDNQPPIQKRTVQDTLPTAAIVAFAACAVGSNRGYDELVPHYIDVVNEKRLYASWAEGDIHDKYPAVCNETTGMVRARQVINKLHVEMGAEEYSELYVDQVTSDIIFVTRHNPHTREAIHLIAHSAFSNLSHPANYIPPLKIWGKVKSVALEASLILPARRESAYLIKAVSNRAKQAFVKDEHFINGLSDAKVPVKTEFPPEESGIIRVTHHDSPHEGHIETVDINPKMFPPGSVVVIRATLTEAAAEALADINAWSAVVPDIGLQQAVKDMNLLDLNLALFCCDGEERVINDGHGCYVVPKAGPLVYAGLQGLWAMLRPVHEGQQLAHPLCDNLRQGNWLLDWLVARLQRSESTRKLGDWMAERVEPLKKLPRYLIPSYLVPVVCHAYNTCVVRAITLMSPFVSAGTDFIERLALTSVQLYGKLNDSPTRDPALPPQPSDDGEGEMDLEASMAAGLPHFANGVFRAWGRDTFVALRGLLLVTGRFKEAKNTLVGFAGTVRHALIPNLLDGSRNPRFNCRDAVWFFLQALQDYCNMAPNGRAILKIPVARLFPSDDLLHYMQSDICRHMYSGPEVPHQPLADVVQEIMQRHFEGIEYREWDAGDLIDRHMKDEGFNVKIRTDRETGLVYGGNRFNCGTWMDKMGESENAGNRGLPATPRDGADIEIIGLLKSTLRWLVELNEQGDFPYDRVKDDHGELTYSEWNRRLQESFETHFYIPTQPADDGQYRLRPEMVHLRGIYKDTNGSSGVYPDYQLRPNQCVAMAVAPELFDREHAREALEIIGKRLMGPLGMKTLDPKDWQYRGDYDNSNDSADFAVARGFNYHQGPEWLWPVGHYLRARLLFEADDKDKVGWLLQSLVNVTNRHYQAIMASPWAGLAELTNSNGQECSYSCVTQAWSSGTLLDALHDMWAVYSRTVDAQ